MAFKIESELTEKQIEADVAGYFGWITPDGTKRFKLIDIDEQEKGADKHFNRFIPIYMQFKVSHGLKKLTSPIFNNTPLQKIRKFRKKNNLFDNPTLYFKLHKKAKTATELQHNILKKLNDIPNTYGFYVAPLTLNKDEYENLLENSLDRYRLDPFYYRDREEIRISKKIIAEIKFIPFLKAHISIIPHEIVTNEKHYYSFAPTGTEIAWHSPYIFNYNSQRLSDVMYNILSKEFYQYKNWKTIADLRLSLYPIAEELNIDMNRFIEGKNIDDIYNFGRILNSKFGIRQILLATNDKFLDQIIDINEY